MNVMPSPAQFDAASSRPRFDVGAERAIIGACLVDSTRVAEVAARLRPHDFYEALNATVLQALQRLVDEGRKPSVESVVAAVGNLDVADGLGLRDHLKQIVRDLLTGMLLPWRDALDVVVDHAQRRSLCSVASDLVARVADGSVSVPDIAGAAVDDLDEVIAATREGKRRSYDAGGAADIALAHLRSSVQTYPTTGLVDLDRVTGGWPRGQLSIIAGRPGMAKSACATGCVLRAAKADYGALFHSLEMQGEQLGSRMLTDFAYQSTSPPIYYEDILHRRVTDDRDISRLEHARHALGKLPVKIEEQRGLTLAEIAGSTRKTAAEFDRAGRRLDVMFVDHIGLVRPSGRYAGNRVRELAEISDGLATLAKDLDIAVVALCQLNRGVEGRENKRPGLSDLRESGAIEEDASLVTFVYRPAYYLENTRFDDQELDRERINELEKVRHVIEFIVGKNRNGRVGVVNAFVDIGANAIRNADFRGKIG